MNQLLNAFGSMIPLFFLIALAVTMISYVVYQHKGVDIRIVMKDRLLLLSVIAILLVTLGTGTYDWNAERIYNLIPIYGTVNMVVNDSQPLRLIFNIFLNILLFMPFGFFMRMCMPVSKKVLTQITLVGMLLSLCIEIAQLILPTGRWADVDDVILNTLGAFFGCVLYERWFGSKRGRKNNKRGRYMDSREEAL